MLGRSYKKPWSVPDVRSGAYEWDSPETIEAIEKTFHIKDAALTCCYRGNPPGYAGGMVMRGKLMHNVLELERSLLYGATQEIIEDLVFVDHRNFFGRCRRPLR